MDIVKRKIPVKIESFGGSPTHKLFCDGAMLAQAAEFFHAERPTLGENWTLKSSDPKFKPLIETMKAFYRNTTNTELPIAVGQIQGIIGFTGSYPPYYGFGFYVAGSLRAHLTLFFEDHQTVNFEDAEWLKTNGWYEAVGIKR